MTYQPAEASRPTTATSPVMNGLAIVSLVTGIVGAIFILSSIAAVISGHIALGQIKRDVVRGRNLALAGVICGYTFSALHVIGYLVFFVLAAALGARAAF